MKQQDLMRIQIPSSPLNNQHSETAKETSQGIVDSIVEITAQEIVDEKNPTSPA